MKHQSVIVRQKEADEKAKLEAQVEQSDDEPAKEGAPEPAEEADEEAVQEAFSTVIAQKKRKARKPYDPGQPRKKKTERKTKDEEHFIPYMAKDYQTESGQVTWPRVIGTSCAVCNARFP